VSGGSQDEALKLALKFLAARARSEAEVRAKLAQAGFSAKIVDTALGKLRSLKLLDDRVFAGNFARSRIDNRGYGPLRLERELRQKGVAGALVRRVLDESFGKREGQERARELLAKRFRGKNLGDAKNLRRAISFLQRRGYRDTTIAEILHQPMGDD
jgi:regulatory protein